MKGIRISLEGMGEVSPHSREIISRTNEQIRELIVNTNFKRDEEGLEQLSYREELELAIRIVSRNSDDQLEVSEILHHQYGMGDKVNNKDIAIDRGPAGNHLFEQLQEMRAELATIKSSPVLEVNLQEDVEVNHQAKDSFIKKIKRTLGVGINNTGP